MRGINLPCNCSRGRREFVEIMKIKVILGWLNEHYGCKPHLYLVIIGSWTVPSSNHHASWLYLLMFNHDNHCVSGCTNTCVIITCCKLNMTKSMKPWFSWLTMPFVLFDSWHNNMRFIEILHLDKEWVICLTNHVLITCPCFQEIILKLRKKGGKNNGTMYTFEDRSLAVLKVVDYKIS